MTAPRTMDHSRLPRYCSTLILTLTPNWDGIRWFVHHRNTLHPPLLLPQFELQATKKQLAAAVERTETIDREIAELNVRSSCMPVCHCPPRRLPHHNLPLPCNRAS